MREETLRKHLDDTFGCGQLSRDGVNYAVPCPFCKDGRKDKRKLVIHLRELKYHCWVCESKGANAIKLLSRHRPDLNLIPEEHRSKAAEETNDEQPFSLPQGMVPLYAPSKDPDVHAALRYLESRKVQEEDVRRWRLHTHSRGFLRRHIVFPSFDSEGNPNYFVGRAIDDVDFKYRNARVPKKSVIFNEIDIDWRSTVILVEGVFDALKCPENTISILGSTIPRDGLLYSRLMEHQSDVIVALDPDLPDKTHRICKDLESAGCSIRYCFAPKGRDFGSMTKEEVARTIEKSKRYDYNARINHKINTIRSGSII
jgi:DNA primase